MNKVTIKDYSVTIVMTTADKKFLLIDKEENSRVANNFEELVELLKILFEQARREGK